MQTRVKKLLDGFVSTILEYRNHHVKPEMSAPEDKTMSIERLRDFLQKPMGELIESKHHAEWIKFLWHGVEILHQIQASDARDTAAIEHFEHWIRSAWNASKNTTEKVVVEFPGSLRFELDYLYGKSVGYYIGTMGMLGTFFQNNIIHTIAPELSWESTPQEVINAFKGTVLESATSGTPEHLHGSASVHAAAESEPVSAGALDAEVSASLTAECAKVIDPITELKEENISLKLELQRLKDQECASQAFIAHLQNTVLTVTNDYEGKIADARNTYQKQLESLKEDAARLESSLASANANVATLTITVESQTKQIEALLSAKPTVSKGGATNSLIPTELEALRSRSASLSLQVDELQTEVALLQERLKTSIPPLRKQNQELEAQNARLRKDLDAKESSAVRSLREEIAELKRDKSKLEARCNGKIAALTELRRLGLFATPDASSDSVSAHTTGAAMRK